MGLKYIPSRFHGLWMVVTWKPGYLEVSWMEAITREKATQLKCHLTSEGKITAFMLVITLLHYCNACPALVSPLLGPSILGASSAKQWRATPALSPRAIPACIWLGRSCKAAFSSRDSSIVTFPLQSIS